MKIGVSGGGERGLIGEGIKVLELKGCEVKAVADRYSDRPGATKDKILWKFRSGQGEDYAIWTNISYGSDKATLTHLLDMMVPGITKAQAADLDTDDLVGRSYRARIVHKVHDATGKTYAQHTYIEPIGNDTEVPPSASVRQHNMTATPAATTTTTPPELSDPFAND